MAITVHPVSLGQPTLLRSSLTTAVRVEGTRTVVGLAGAADLSTRPVLSDVLSRVIAFDAGDVVIDLAEVDFVDTAIGRAFSVCRQLLERRGRKVTFRSPAKTAARVLQLFCLAELIETTDSAEP